MNTENTEIYVARTLEAGVEPIELRFLPMYDCYEHRVIGYTGRALINSVLYGTLAPKDYMPALEDESTGAELAVRSLKNTAAALLGTSADLSGLEYAGVLCPPSALTEPRLYDRLAGLAEHTDKQILKILHLEFDRAILSLDRERVCSAFSDIRAAGFSVAVRGYGEAEFPMTALIDTAPDVVFLASSAVALSGNRETAAAVPALVRFAGSLGVRVIAEGVWNDGQVRELNSAECTAFLPSGSYRGAYELSADEGRLPRLLTEREKTNGDK